MAFKYRKRAPEDVKARANQSGGSYDSFTDTDIPRFKVGDGDNIIRILPPAPDLDTEKWGNTWSIEIWLHNQIGADKAAYLCLTKMRGKPCPICDMINELSDEEIADRLKPKKRSLCYIIDRDDEKVGPQLFPMPWTLEKKISARSIDKKTGEILFIDDPDEGYDVTFTKEGAGLKTKYEGETIDRDSSPIVDNQKTQDKWLDFISDNPLDKVLKFYSAEHLELVCQGQKSRATDDDKKDDDKPEKEERSSRRRRDDDDEDEKPKAKEEKAERPSRRSRDSEDEDEEKEKDERPTTRGRRGNDEDEDVKPARPKRSSKDEDPEDEPEEKPRRSRRDEPEEKPRRSRDADEDDEPKAKRPAKRDEDEDEEEQEAKKSMGRLRERSGKR